MLNSLVLAVLSVLLFPLAALAQTPEPPRAGLMLVAAVPPASQAPVGIAAGSPPAKVNLSWTASATPAANVAGYDVFRSTSPGTEAGTTALNGATPITTTAYIDSTAVAGTTYFYTVSTQSTAALGSKLSAFSNEVSAVVPSNPAPPTLGVVTFSVVPAAGGKQETITASYQENAAGAQTEYQLWSGAAVLKQAKPSIAASGAYTVTWTGKITSAPKPSLTVEDDAGNVATSVAGN
jgi:hypothetical protein